MWTKDENGKLLVLNKYGDMVPGRDVLPRYFGVFWQTTAGLWVKKVIAVRDGLELTGVSRRMSTTPQITIIPK